MGCRQHKLNAAVRYLRVRVRGSCPVFKINIAEQSQSLDFDELEKLLYTSWAVFVALADEEEQALLRQHILEISIANFPTLLDYVHINLLQIP